MIWEGNKSVWAAQDELHQHDAEEMPDGPFAGSKYKHSLVTLKQNAVYPIEVSQSKVRNEDSSTGSFTGSFTGSSTGSFGLRPGQGRAQSFKSDTALQRHMINTIKTPGAFQVPCTNGDQTREEIGKYLALDTLRLRFHEPRTEALYLQCASDSHKSVGPVLFVSAAFASVLGATAKFVDSQECNMTEKLTLLQAIGFVILWCLSGTFFRRISVYWRTLHVLLHVSLFCCAAYLTFLCPSSGGLAAISPARLLVACTVLVTGSAMAVACMRFQEALLSNLSMLALAIFFIQWVDLCDEEGPYLKMANNRLCAYFKAVSLIYLVLFTVIGQAMAFYIEYQQRVTYRSMLWFSQETLRLALELDKLRWSQSHVVSKRLHHFQPRNKSNRKLGGNLHKSWPNRDEFSRFTPAEWSGGSSRGSVSGSINGRRNSLLDRISWTMPRLRSRSVGALAMGKSSLSASKARAWVPEFNRRESRAGSTVWQQSSSVDLGSFFGRAETSLGHNQRLYLPLVDQQELEMKWQLPRGSFGQAHVATHRDNTVLFKRVTFPDTFTAADKEAVVHAFATEASRLAELCHPNVVPMLGTVLSPESIGVVTEFFPMGDLREVLAQARAESVVLSPSLLLRTMLGICRGMRFLHSLAPPMMHGALTSHNVLLNSSFRVKITDCAVSCLRRVKRRVDGDINEWMAPEVLKKVPPTKRADVYSFGVVLYEMLYDEAPYAGLPRSNLRVLVIKRGGNPWSCTNMEAHERVRDRLPEGYRPLIDLMRQCLEFEAKVRPLFDSINHELESLARTVQESPLWEQDLALPQLTVRSEARDQDLVDTKRDDSTMIGDPDNLKTGRRIGAGSCGVVFEGKYHGTRVALKRLHVQTQDVGMLNEFSSDCARLLKLRHPNVLLFMGATVDAATGSMTVVTELMDLGSLRRLVETVPRSQDVLLHTGQAVSLIMDVARAGAYLHDASRAAAHDSVIHGSLTSHNVLVDGQWGCKLAVTGLRSFRQSSPHPSVCAPEVLRGEEPTAASDLFSFAMVMWEAIAWAAPPPFARPEVPLHCPPLLAEVMEQGWSDDPAARPDFSEVLMRLAKVREIRQPVPGAVPVYQPAI